MKIIRALYCLMIFCIAQPLLAQTTLKSEAQLIDIYSKEKNPSKKFIALLDIGIYYQANNITKADSLNDKIVSYSRDLADSLRLAALIYKAETELLKGNRVAYFSTVLGCQPFLNRVSDDASQVKIFKHLGNYHLMLKENETADFYFRRMLKASKVTRSKVDVVQSHLYLSKTFTESRLKDSALHHIDIALQNARRSSVKTLLAECYHQQANTYREFDQMELWVSKNILALQIATDNHNYGLASLYSIEVGRAQYAIKNFEEAGYYFRQAMDFASRVRNESLIATSLVELASIHFSKRKFTEAITNCQKAASIFERLDNTEGQGLAANMLGIIYREQKEFVKAGSQFNQALIHFESIGDIKQIATVYHNVGTVFFAQKKYANALNYLNKSLEINRGNGMEAQMYNTYRTMANVYKELGQSQKAFEYLDLYVSYLDSSSTELATGKIAELNELYRAEQRDQLILSQSDSLERQRQEKQLTSAQLENVELRSNFLKYTILGIVLIIILFSVLLYNRWNQNKILQQQREAEMNQTLLRAQMNPHFVFNAMSVIQSYIYENDTENSSKFLVNFSRLMRLILENSSKEEIPIGLEEEILLKYLGTQKLRFEDRFEFKIDIDEELRNEQAMIPPMITQPFIENSIEHGQLHTIEGGFIQVRFAKRKNMLEVTIEDNGIGRKGAEKNKKSRDHKSMAMNITYERINNLNKKYKTEGYLVIEDFDKQLQTGTKVLISLPYRTENQTN